MADYMKEFHPTPRLLMGPGPSNVHPRVLQAMASPVVGHLDPQFVQVMIDVREMLRPVFGTRDGLTLALSGTGHAGMEASFCNLLEHGEKVLIAVNGFFGQRMTDIAARVGGEVHLVESTWGKPLDVNAIEVELKRLGRVKVVAMIHAETSTGVLNPVPEVARLAHEHGALLILDTVTSLGGMKVAMDEWDVDIAYSASQKCLGSPPGLSPISLEPRALEAMKARKTRVQSYYLDLVTLADYWSKTPRYHHTAPVSMFYAFRESLRMLHEEGLEVRFKRHTRNAAALWAGIEAMGLKLMVEPKWRLPQLTTVLIPEGVDDVKVRSTLLNEYNLEISGGFGPLAGKIWRVGLMGEGCYPSSVFYFLSSLEQVLTRMGYELPIGEGVAAAARALADYASSAR